MHEVAAEKAARGSLGVMPTGPITGSDAQAGDEDIEHVQTNVFSVAEGDENIRKSTASGTRRAVRGEDHAKLVPKKLRKDLEKPKPEIARMIVENKYFQVGTFLMTIYALVGSDMRLITTQQSADPIFDVVTCVCILVFAVEIVLGCFGKDDYFASFFFLLDVASTVTLLLDITVVNEWLQRLLATADEDTIGSKQAKLGTRMFRVVRVIRLVRVVKLYKAIYEAHRARQQAKQRTVGPGYTDEDWANAEDPDKQEQVNALQRESRVGKKLFDMTIRRVIVLVLLMIVLLPILRVDATSMYPTSAQYGADIVYEKLRKRLEDTDNEAYQNAYEKALLQYMYYHNWFQAQEVSCEKGSRCPNLWTSSVFWVGIASENAKRIEEVLPFAKVRPEAVSLWSARVAGQDDDYNFGSMPRSAEEILGSNWTKDCSSDHSDRRRVGLSVLAREDPAIVCPADLRLEERFPTSVTLITQEDWENDFSLVFYFDQRFYVREDAAYSIGLTAFVCVSLCTAALYFNNDANRLVLHPVENMIAKVETIRLNPLMAMKMADEEFKAEEVRRAKARVKVKTNTEKIIDRVTCTSEKEVEIMETVILEKTIIKLGSLLALGFGEAGTSIIEHNMRGIESACVDAMVDGSRVDCVIGVVRIRDFSTATEVLQAKVMSYVNQIAEIVHGVVTEFHGAANRNSGDQFLVIWKTSLYSGSKGGRLVQKLADMSIMAMTKVLGAIHRSPVLATYRGHPGLQQRMGKVCRVNISSGLHHGWAIEGAVGSEFKIDASYLSPHVSIAESVEFATEVYGVNTLFAESVVCLASPKIAAKCRLIDRVLISGSALPMNLFCIDLDYMSLTVEKPYEIAVWNSRQRFRARKFLEIEKGEKIQENVHMVDLFNENEDIALMRFRYTLEFLNVFDMGYQNYAEGEWDVAKRYLTRTMTMLGTVDGPSQALLAFMRTPFDFKAPPDWRGVRQLSHLGEHYT